MTDVLPNGISEDQLLKIAASIEKQSEHPFARAIVEKASGMPLSEVKEFVTPPGRGACGTLDGEKYYGGSENLMEELSVQVPRYEQLADSGKTMLYFAAASGRYLGVIAAADVLKEDSCPVVAQMHRLNLEVVMLSGDNGRVANAVAAQAGIRRVISDVLLVDKAGAVQALRQEGRNVLMAGDSINDAPALVTADVGMAIGAGTDVAIESADVVLMSSSLMGVTYAIQLSKATICNIRQNLFWAFFYNCLRIPIAAGVLYPAFGLPSVPCWAPPL